MCILYNFFKKYMRSLCKKEKIFLAFCTKNTKKYKNFCAKAKIDLCNLHKFWEKIFETLCKKTLDIFCEMWYNIKISGRSPVVEIKKIKSGKPPFKFQDNSTDQ